MKMKNIIKGFTLIELLVAITIIGILATGWVAIFTKQLQGARDSSRINDIKLLESSAQMYFSDNDAFPAATWFTWAIAWYTTKKLSDPKTGVTVCRNATVSNIKCNWFYAVWPDSFNLPDSSMKLWVLFEKEENTKNIAADTWAKWDGWNSPYTYEVFAWAWAWNWRTIDPAAATPVGTLVY